MAKYSDAIKHQVIQESVCKVVEDMTPQELMEEVRYLRAEAAYLKKLDALIQQNKLAEKNKPKSSQN